ncbi:unnamed protein product [Urochloa humidicola]
MAIPGMQLSLPVLLLLPVLSYISYHLTRALTKKKPTTHGLKSHPLVGHLPAFLKNRHRFLDWSTELILASPQHRMGFWIPGMRTGIVTANPADVEHVLRANFTNYPKGEHAISMLEDFLGHGLFNSDGEQWLWQRKNASHEFSKRSLRSFVVDVVQAEVANRLLPLLRWSSNNAATGAAVLDLQDVLERFAFDTICMVAFGHDPGCLADGEVRLHAHVRRGAGPCCRQIPGADRGVMEGQEVAQRRHRAPPQEGHRRRPRVRHGHNVLNCRL